MTYEFITYEKKGRIAYVTITRPERLNALQPTCECRTLPRLLRLPRRP